MSSGNAKQVLQKCAAGRLLGWRCCVQADSSLLGIPHAPKAAASSSGACAGSASISGSVRECDARRSSHSAYTGAEASVVH